MNMAGCCRLRLAKLVVLGEEYIFGGGVKSLVVLLYENVDQSITLLYFENIFKSV